MLALCRLIGAADGEGTHFVVLAKWSAPPCIGKAEGSGLRGIGVVEGASLTKFGLRALRRTIGAADGEGAHFVVLAKWSAPPCVCEAAGAVRMVFAQWRAPPYWRCAEPLGQRTARERIAVCLRSGVHLFVFAKRRERFACH